MAITRSKSTQVSSNPVKIQKRKRVAFEQTRASAIPNGHLRQKNSKVSESVDIGSAGASQKVDVSKRRKQVTASSRRLRRDSAIASGQLRSGKIRSNFSDQDSDNTIAGSSSSSSPTRYAAQLAHLENLRAKRQSKLEAKAIAKANAEAEKLAAAEAAKVAAEAAKVAADAAAEAAARAQTESRQAEMRAVAGLEDLLKTVIVEETNEGTLPITDEDREEAREIVRRFKTAYCLWGCLISRLERVYNAQLEERYTARKEIFVSDQEAIMFHGTTLHSVKKIVTEGFKIGGIDGHPLTHGAAMGYGVYTNNEPWPSFRYCLPLHPTSQIIALRCLPGVYGESYRPDHCNSIGSPTSTLVLKTSEQCLPRYIIHFTTLIPGPHRVPDTMEIFSKILQNAPKIVFTKVEVGVRN